MGLLDHTELADLHADEIRVAEQELSRREDDAERRSLLLIQIVEYLKRGIRWGDLKTVLFRDLYDRWVREYDVVTREVGGAQRIAPVLERFVDGFGGPVLNDGLSMIFYGFNDTGKTIAATYLLARAIEQGYGGYYCEFSDYARWMNRASFDGDRVMDRVVRYIRRCPLLIVDEIGKEGKLSDHVISTLEHLVKRRVASSLSTVLVTNLDFRQDPPQARYDELKSAGKHRLGAEFWTPRYGQSVYSVLQQLYKAYQFSSQGRFRQRTRSDW